MKNLLESIRVHIYDRLSSPLFGAFCIAWLAWNHQYLLILCSDEHIVDRLELSRTAIFPDGWSIARRGFIYPFLSGAVFILVYPHVSRLFYGYWLRRQLETKQTRDKIENATLLTLEESRKLRVSMAQAQSKYDEEISRLVETNKALRLEIENRSKEKLISDESLAKPPKENKRETTADRNKSNPAQEALRLLYELNGSITDEVRRSEVAAECEQWWKANKLRLSKEARDIFAECFITAQSISSIVDLAKGIRPLESSQQRDNIRQNIGKALELIESEADAQIDEPSLLNGALRKERFTDQPDWNRLIKIGAWGRFPDKEEFQGEGVDTYLLSRFKYGERPFRIAARLCFRELSPQGETAAVNAGIVFGWQGTSKKPRYYHLMFTGKSLILELVGGRTGGVYEDFQHIGPRVEFELQRDRFYYIELQVADGDLTVLIDGRKKYEASNLEDPMGRVGLRPWRSLMVSDRFEVNDEKQ
ncbi:MAG: hypothetical protein NT105_13810 [Verrucomicrobia bacterium]|nr:hypothetical protein [Verrucomicrobiota bacterium]